MKQFDIISELPAVFSECRGIKAALLIGSFARNQEKLKSDIDYSLWIDTDNFNPEDLSRLLGNKLPSILKIMHVKLRHRIVVYFTNCPKLELAWYDRLSDIDRNFLGSEIEDISKSIVYQQSEIDVYIKEYLNKINDDKRRLATQNSIECQFNDLVDKFIYEFEASSNKHNRSDSYQFYFFYNIALDVAIKLNYISICKLKRQKIEHVYLPKNFICNYESAGRPFFTELNGTLYLPEADDKKRKLLDFFYVAIERMQIHSSEEFQEIKDFLESIWHRDRIWNFRDAAKINTKFKPNKIFRSSFFSRYQDDKFFADFLRGYKINKIIDLRKEKEYKENPYNIEMLKYLSIEHLLLSINLVPYHELTTEFQHVIKSIFERIDPENDTVLIHCFAGKDRTGTLIALLGLLIGENIQNIQKDFLASEMDTNLDDLNSFLGLLQKRGIIDYLLDCGISLDKIEQWEKALSMAY